MTIIAAITIVIGYLTTLRVSHLMLNQLSSHDEIRGALDATD